MLDAPELTVMVRGRLLRGWTKVRWASSLNILVDTLSINLPASIVQGFRGGEEITAFLGGELFFTGFVESVEAKVTGSESSAAVVCRSATADIVDSSVDLQRLEAELPNATIQTVAQQYVRLWLGLAYENKVEDLPRLPKVSLQVGESVFSVLERYAKQSGVVLRTSPEGTLVIDRAGGVGTALPLTLGDQVSGFSIKRSVSNRFRETKVIGQTTNPEDFGATVSSGVAIDEAIRLARVRVLHADGPAGSDSCQREAEWTAAIAVSRSSRVAVGTQGWTSNGELLKPNRVVDLVTGKYGFNARLVIHTVECEVASNTGFIARLQLVYQGSFIPKPKRTVLDDDVLAWMETAGWA